MWRHEYRGYPSPAKRGRAIAYAQLDRPFYPSPEGGGWPAERSEAGRVGAPTRPRFARPPSPASRGRDKPLGRMRRRCASISSESALALLAAHRRRRIEIAGAALEIVFELALVAQA